MAAIQALNGIAGFFVALPRLVKSEGFSGTQIILIAAIVFSMLGFLAGFYLWRGHSLGLWMTAAYQLPQLAKIKSELLIYQVEFGTSLDLLLIPQLNGAVTWGYRANFYLRNQISEPQITINLIALLFLYLIYRATAKKNSERQAA